MVSVCVLHGRPALLRCSDAPVEAHPSGRVRTRACLLQDVENVRLYRRISYRRRTPDSRQLRRRVPGRLSLCDSGERRPEKHLGRPVLVVRERSEPLIPPSLESTADRCLHIHQIAPFNEHAHQRTCLTILLAPTSGTGLSLG